MSCSCLLKTIQIHDKLYAALGTRRRFFLKLSELRILKTKNSLIHFMTDIQTVFLTTKARPERSLTSLSCYWDFPHKLDQIGSDWLKLDQVESILV